MWDRMVGLCFLWWIATSGAATNCEITVLERGPQKEGMVELEIECGCGKECETELRQKSGADGTEKVVRGRLLRLNIALDQLACNCASSAEQKFVRLHRDVAGKIVVREASPTPSSLRSTQEQEEIKPITFAIILGVSAGFLLLVNVLARLGCYYYAKRNPESELQPPPLIPEPKTEKTQRGVSERTGTKKLTSSGMEDLSSLVLDEISLTHSSECEHWIQTPAELK